MGNAAAFPSFQEDLSGEEDLSRTASFFTDETSLNEVNQASEPILTQGPVGGICMIGAVGKFASRINSSFIETGKMYNDRMLYKTVSKPTHWLRYTTAEKWIISNTKDKGKNSWGGFCRCKASGLSDPSHVKMWYVLNEQGTFQTQANICSTSITSEECNQLEELLLLQQRRQSVRAVKVQGATGTLASKINGVYKCKRDNKNRFGEPAEFERRLSESSSESITISSDEPGRWIVGMELPGNDLVLLAYCQATKGSGLCGTTRWFVSNSAAAFIVQPCMTVTPVDLETETEIHQVPIQPTRKTTGGADLKKMPESTNLRQRLSSIDTDRRYRRFYLGDRMPIKTNLQKRRTSKTRQVTFLPSLNLERTNIGVPMPAVK